MEGMEAIFKVTYFVITKNCHPLVRVAVTKTVIYWRC